MSTPSRIAILAASLTLAVAAAHASNFQRQVPADPRGEVDVSNVAGDIVVSGWDQSAVSVTADLPSDTQRVQVTSSGGRTSVCVVYGDNGCNSSGGFNFKGSVRLEVHVPRGSELEVSGVSADITSRNVAGHQHLNTVSGNINAELGSGDDEVNSVSGDVKLQGSGQEGSLHVNSVSGDLRVSNVAGELDAHTVDGALIAQLSSARLVRLNTTSGEIHLDTRLTSSGTIDTETVSGEQTFHVSAPGGFTYEVRTLSGDIDNCFGQRSVRPEYGPGNRLDGTRGAGNGHIRIHSLSGGISLCDH